MRLGRYRHLFENVATEPLDYDRWHELAGKVTGFSTATLKLALRSYADIIDDGLRYVEVGDILKQRLRIEALDLWMRLTACGIKRLNGSVEKDFRCAEFSRYRLTGELNHTLWQASLAYRRMIEQRSAQLEDNRKP